MNRIIFLSIEPLNVAINQKYLIRSLSERNFSVEYWNLALLYGFPTYHPTNDMVFEKQVESFKDLKFLMRKEDNKNTVFSFIFTYNSKYYSIIHYLKQFGFKTVFYAFGFDRVANSKTVKIPLLQRLKKANFRDAILNRLTPYLVKSGYIKNFDLIFSPINQFVLKKLNRLLISNEAEFVLVNASDYESYRESIDIKADIKADETNKTIVFLDQNLPFHPDSKIASFNTVNPEKYYSNLLTFFCKISKCLGLKIVIAAHPTADIDRICKYLPDFDVIKGRTADLVNNSSCVICHISNAICYPICNNIPIIFIADEEVRTIMPSFYAKTKYQADTIGCKFVDVSENYELDKESLMYVDVDKYAKYKYSFYTSPRTEKMSNIDIYTQTYLKM